jgi:hypothetical protein
MRNLFLITNSKKLQKKREIFLRSCENRELDLKKKEKPKLDISRKSELNENDLKQVSTKKTALSASESALDICCSSNLPSNLSNTSLSTSSICSKKSSLSKKKPKLKSLRL